MQYIIAIEGIDRIGKSTMIDSLYKILSETNPNTRIEKPTIGLNTLHNDEYPLRNVPGIMEMRNIGLFEELLFQCKHRFSKPDEIIIRDRFNLSELAYGQSLREEQFDRVMNAADSYELYSKWNSWFETQLQTVAGVWLITFVLDESSYPNEDEVVTAKDLVTVNEKFKKLHDESKFIRKKKIVLHRGDDGLTDIESFIPEILMWIRNESVMSLDTAVATADKTSELQYMVHTIYDHKTIVFNIDGKIIIIGEYDNNTDICTLINDIVLTPQQFNDIIHNMKDYILSQYLKLTCKSNVEQIKELSELILNTISKELEKLSQEL